jgi:hypothetical protein
MTCETVDRVIYRAVLISALIGNYFGLGTGDNLRIRRMIAIGALKGQDATA